MNEVLEGCVFFPPKCLSSQELEVPELKKDIEVSNIIVTFEISSSSGYL